MIFLLMLSREIDKTLFYISINSKLHRQSEAILLHLFEMSAAEEAYRTSPTTLNYERFFKARSYLQKTRDILQALSYHQPLLTKWIPVLEHEISLRDHAMHSLNLNQNRFLQTDKKPPSPSYVKAPVAPEFSYQPQYLIQLLSSFQKMEEKELFRHHQYLDMLRATLAFVSILAITSSFAFGFLIHRRFRQHIFALRQYQRELQNKNAFLEKSVYDRTIELNEARLHAEKERNRVEILLEEASHRIGNSLATVSSLLNLQAKETENKEAQESLLSARDRIHTISIAHRRLRLGKDHEKTETHTFFNNVLNDTQELLPKETLNRVSIIADIAPFYIPTRDATTLAIIVGELMTNAVKYAFPEERKGTIKVFFGKIKPNNFCTLIIEDDGIGFPETQDKKKKNGLGHTVVIRLCKQFGDKCYFEKTSNGGTRFVAPLPNLKSEEKSDEDDEPDTE